ncbi:MAG TPA: hypothetical protein VE177_02445 [Candidatus Binatus sp.]|nr:hypothetical protein [Candidatus Binatus sp.]
MTPKTVKFHKGRRPWRTIRTRKLLARGEVKLYEDHLVSASGLKTKHLRLLLNDFSIIVPVLDDHRLVFEWNYRHALEGWELELPAGLIEDGEMPLRLHRENSKKRPVILQDDGNRSDGSTLSLASRANAFMSSLPRNYGVEELIGSLSK